MDPHPHKGRRGPCWDPGLATKVLKVAGCRGPLFCLLAPCRAPESQLQGRGSRAPSENDRAGPAGGRACAQGHPEPVLTRPAESCVAWLWSLPVGLSLACPESGVVTPVSDRICSGPLPLPPPCLLLGGGEGGGRRSCCLLLRSGGLRRCVLRVVRPWVRRCGRMCPRRLQSSCGVPWPLCGPCHPPTHPVVPST